MGYGFIFGGKESWVLVDGRRNRIEILGLSECEGYVSFSIWYCPPGKEKPCPQAQGTEHKCIELGQ